MTRREAAEKTAALDPAKLPGAVEAPLPDSVRPMLATLAGEPHDSPDWLYEIKWDGVRAMAFIENGAVRLQSRSLRDITDHYPELSGIAEHVKARRAVLDGEIVALDQQGRSSFERLQQRMNLVPDRRVMDEHPVVYYAFDLLYLDGYDLRDVVLESRKEALRRILLPGGGQSRVRFSEHHAGEGRALLEAARGQNLEGIVGKRRASCYAGKRSMDWQKFKITREIECVVGGYTEPRRSREYFGSLVLGQYDDKGKLVHVGNAGSGFTRASQKQTWEELEPLRTGKSPFAGRPATLERPHWVRPELIACVKFTEWTSDRKMRAPVVLSVRRGPRVMVRNPEPAAEPDAEGRGESQPPERPKASNYRQWGPLFTTTADTEIIEADGRRMQVKNLSKLFFPGEGYTKRDVLEFYHRISAFILPHMRDKPVSMKRYPDGIHKPFFFQKEAGESMPAWMKTVPIESGHGKKDFINYVVCNDRAALIYLANLGCIEQNLWLSRAGSLENPDFVLFDLDPGENAAFDQVVEVARVLKKKLDLLGLTGYPKTSGASGMHIYVPLVPEYGYEDSRMLAELVSALVAEEAGRLVTAERSLRRRPQDRVYLDFLQNGFSKTVPPPYSLRATAGATVSTPVRWDEVRPGLDPRQFNIRSIWERLEKEGDLFAGTLTNRQRLEDALARLQETIEHGSRL